LRAVVAEKNEKQKEEKNEKEEEKKNNIIIRIRKNKWLDCTCGCNKCGQSIPSPFPMILIRDTSCNSPI
jgi:hypothetical protein